MKLTNRRQARDSKLSKPTRVTDISGQRFGRLVAISFAGLTTTKQARWLCKCDCGNEHTVTARHLKTGDTKSCGCIPADRLIIPIKKQGTVPNTSGIYRIKSLIDDREYVGSAVSLPERCRLHEFHLHHHKHSNKHLQNFYNKYTGASLEFSVIEECHINDLLKREQYFIDTIRPAFNICMVAGNSLGRKHSEETCNLISIKKKGTIRNIGFKHSLETRAKVSASGKGKRVGVKRAPFTTEHCNAISKTRIARLISAGENNHFAKLTETIVIEIRHALANGATNSTIQKKYGLSKGAVSHIRTGRTWRHILPPHGDQ